MFRNTGDGPLRILLPCGVYDPAQARIEAESVKAVQEKMAANDDPH
ncbi:superoxide dismutase [Ni], partial [Streptomyces sp. NPDC001595]